MRFFSKSWTFTVIASALMAGACFAETAEPTKFYKLDFIVKEVDGAKVLNARAYSMTTSANGSIRAGSKVPVSGQSSYLDVGVNIDTSNLKETGNGLIMFINAEVSTVLHESGSVDQKAPAGVSSLVGSSALPVIRQNKWSSTAVIPFRKPTVIFSSDDAASTHRIELEVTATPLK
jgi:hypothetical protein